MGVEVPTIVVKVKPNARQSRIEQLADGSYSAELKSPPVDGKANAELIGLVAQAFGCPKSAVEIKSGGASRIKRVTVPGE
jgi:uncharacterized protein (TIGR00251 family)